MSVLQKTVSAGLIATTLAVASLATTAPAAAHDRFWGGVAAGAVGGLIGGALLNQGRPVYGGPVYAAPVYGAPVYYRAYAPPPRYCHREWRYDEWDRPYRVEVCR